jgi:phage gp36-like protein
MAYATGADLELAFGAQELIALADRNRDGVADVAVLERALDEASAEIDSYVLNRLAARPDPVPPQLRAIACDIARYRLSASNPREATLERYRQALAALRDIATGKAVIGLDVSGGGAGDGGAVATDPGVAYYAEPSPVSDSALGGY